MRHHCHHCGHKYELQGLCPDCTAKRVAASRGPRPPALQWLDVPTEPGWWWCWPAKGSDKEPQAPYVVSCRDVDGELWASFPSDVGFFPFDCQPTGKWLGPIDAPTPPEDEG